MLSETEIKKIADEAADKAIRKFLLALGVATGTEDSVIALQADFSHLRNSRLAVVAIKARAMGVATSAFVMGCIGAAALYLNGKGTH